MHNTWSSLRPQWRPAGALAGQVSPALKNWLLDKGSLTERLIHQFSGEFRVELISQRWARASSDEAKALGLSVRDRVMVREVLLWGGERPCVFARSILPYRSLQGRLKALNNLDTRPLGAWLFQQRDLRRGPIEVASFRGAVSLPDILMNNPPAWGRRSVFSVDNHPLLVAEVFLEPLLRSIEAAPHIAQ